MPFHCGKPLFSYPIDTDVGHMTCKLSLNVLILFSLASLCSDPITTKRICPGLPHWLKNEEEMNDTDLHSTCRLEIAQLTDSLNWAILTSQKKYKEEKYKCCYNSLIWRLLLHKVIAVVANTVTNCVNNVILWYFEFDNLDFCTDFSLSWVDLDCNSLEIRKNIWRMGFK